MTIFSRRLLNPLLLLLLQLFLLLQLAAAAEVATLTDENFEHDTQASTGSTTGSWLVLCHQGPNDAELNGILQATPDGAEEGTTLVDALLEKGVVVGRLDVDKNPKVVERFKIPYVLLIMLSFDVVVPHIWNFSQLLQFFF